MTPFFSRGNPSFLSMILPVLGAFKWIHTIFVLLCLIYLTWHVFRVHLGCSMLAEFFSKNEYYPLYDIPQFTYSFICWQTFPLFLPVDFCEWHCCECWCTSVCLNLAFSYFLYLSRSRIAGSYSSIPGLGRSPGEGNGNPLQDPWKIPWAEESGRLQSIGSQRVRHDWVTSLYSNAVF